MKDKLDVFEILGTEHKESEKKGQEQISVPDPDFNEAIKQLGTRYSEKTTDETGTDRTKTGTDKSERKRVLTEKAVPGRIRRLLKLSLAIAVILLFVTFVVNVPRVVGSSMEPALKDGDRVVINLLARNYEVGDIIVFETDSGDKLIKRIVAVSGDVVDITSDKEFYINGREVEEQYIYAETAVTDITVSYPVIVNEGTYFVMGDNRSNSKDSRDSEIGLVDKEDIVGKVMFCWRKY